MASHHSYRLTHCRPPPASHVVYCALTKRSHECKEMRASFVHEGRLPGTWVKQVRRADRTDKEICDELVAGGLVRCVHACRARARAEGGDALLGE
jgi:hypothetical protein